MRANARPTTLSRNVLAGLATATALSVGGPVADPVCAQERVAPVLVDADWLEARLDDPSVAVFHVAMGMRGAPEEYISGSSFLDYHAFAGDQNGLRIEMMPVDDMVEALRAAGIDNDDHVVLYGSGHIPARVFMTLDYLGHGERTSVLDGNMEYWQSQGRPTSSESATRPRGSFTADVQDDVLVSADWIAERLDDPAVTLIDARPEAEYTGESSGPNLRPGHIPGAYNLYWPELQVSEEQPVLRNPAQVVERFHEAGATADGYVVSYCYIGMRASYTYMVSKHMGYQARFYDGSWNEWGARDDLPAVKGKARR